MKKIFITVFLLSLLTGCKNDVTFETLLSDMVDREAVTQHAKHDFKTLQASSYNRESVSIDSMGWFADSDGLGYIREEKDKDGNNQWVIMEDDGPGAITRIWAVCFYKELSNQKGGNISIYLDGNDKPVISTNLFDLVKGLDFVKAPFADSSVRSANMYLPIPYSKGCKVVMDCEPFYNTITYRSYADSVSVESFSMNSFKKNQQLLNDVASCLESRNTVEPKNVMDFSDVSISAGSQASFDLPQGNNAIYNFSIKFNGVNKEDMADVLRKTIILSVFDNIGTIWCPVGEFFANTTGNNSYDMWERSITEDGVMTCRWVMPYENEGMIQIQNLSDKKINFDINIGTSPRVWTKNSLHFNAGWFSNDSVPSFPIRDLNVFLATGAGNIVGDNMSVLTASQGWWGEGDEKIFIDDDLKIKKPSHFGTGTEDYYGWAGGVIPTKKDEFYKPFVANILVGEPQCLGYNICARSRSLDAIPFKQGAIFMMEASSGVREYWNNMLYNMTIFWYADARNTLTNLNKEPNEKAAKKGVMTLSELQAINEKAKKTPYVIENVLEAETITDIVSKSEGTTVNNETPEVWGNFSNGSAKYITMKSPSDYIELNIPSTSKSSSKILLCAAVGPDMGSFDVFINGMLSKANLNLNSTNSGITKPLATLGFFKPNDKGFYNIKFVAKKGGNLVLDYFRFNEVSDKNDGENVKTLENIKEYNPDAKK